MSAIISIATIRESGNGLSRDEFEQAYAERSGVTVEFLHHWGRYAESCDCGGDICWCKPTVEPGILGCRITHNDVTRPLLK